MLNTKGNEMTKTAQDVENSLTSLTGLSPAHFENMMRRVEKLYDAGGVKRMHAVPTLRLHTIAEHVYGSTLIAVELFNLNVKVAAAEGLSLSWENIVSALLVHDAPEVDTGDIPAPVKRASKEISDAIEELETRFYEDFGIWNPGPSLNRLEKDIVKAADCLDLAMLCVRERLMGNRHPELWSVFYNALDYTYEKRNLDGVQNIRKYMYDVWRSV